MTAMDFTEDELLEMYDDHGVTNDVG